MANTIVMKSGRAVVGSVKNRLYESMTRVRVGDYVVRVWMGEGGLYAGPNKVVKERLEYLPAGSIAKIGEVIDGIDGVEAYEILDRDGNGVVVYPDWK